jgi:uroporphyrinogen-III decarboxylase
VALANLQAVWQAVGERAQVVFMSGTDFGAQQGPLCSPAAYRELFFPHQKRLNDWVHANTSWKVFIHSCGAVADLIEGFIAAGFDILNPVQCQAAGMAAEGLKARFGDRIVFWGGGVNTQHTLPKGTPAEVGAEVAERIRCFKPGGRFVYNSIHNLQADVPVENFVAMMEAFEANASY